MECKFQMLHVAFSSFLSVLSFLNTYGLMRYVPIEASGWASSQQHIFGTVSEKMFVLLWNIVLIIVKFGFIIPRCSKNSELNYL